MRTHVREQQSAKFLGAIAGELPGRHEFASQRPSQDRRMRDLDRDLFLGTGGTVRDKKSNGYSQTSNHSYRRAAAVDLLSIRSTDHAPDPAIIIAAVIASTST